MILKKKRSKKKKTYIYIAFVVNFLYLSGASWIVWSTVTLETKKQILANVEEFHTYRDNRLQIILWMDLKTQEVP